MPSVAVIFLNKRIINFLSLPFGQCNNFSALAKPIWLIIKKLRNTTAERFCSTSLFEPWIHSLIRWWRDYYHLKWKLFQYRLKYEKSQAKKLGRMGNVGCSSPRLVVGWKGERRDIHRIAEPKTWHLVRSSFRKNHRCNWLNMKQLLVQIFISYIPNIYSSYLR